MKAHALGKLYRDGECVVFEGDPSEYLYIVQEGQVEIAYDEADRTTRLVLLPFEDHGYRARESVEHVLWEQLEWFDTHLRGAEGD